MSSIFIMILRGWKVKCQGTRDVTIPLSQRTIEKFLLVFQSIHVDPHIIFVGI